jgi:hypothetical protein
MGTFKLFYPIKLNNNIINKIQKLVIDILLMSNILEYQLLIYFLFILNILKNID